MRGTVHPNTSSSSSSPARRSRRIVASTSPASTDGGFLCANSAAFAAPSAAVLPCARGRCTGPRAQAISRAPWATVRACSINSHTSSALVTNCAHPSRIARWQPSLIGLSMDPGTHPASRERSSTAIRAVSSAPDRLAASTTIVTNDSAAMMRLRRGKRSGRTEIPAGCSVIVHPPASTIASKSGA